MYLTILFGDFPFMPFRKTQLQTAKIDDDSFPHREALHLVAYRGHEDAAKVMLRPGPPWGTDKMDSRGTLGDLGPEKTTPKGVESMALN